MKDESLCGKAACRGNTGECGGFDQSAMKSEVSSLKVVNWHTWPITTQHCTRKAIAHGHYFMNCFEVLEHFCFSWMPLSRGSPYLHLNQEGKARWLWFPVICNVHCYFPLEVSQPISLYFYVIQDPHSRLLSDKIVNVLGGKQLTLIFPFNFLKCFYIKKKCRHRNTFCVIKACFQKICEIWLLIWRVHSLFI